MIARKDGTFEVLQGTPTLNRPQPPKEPNEAVTLAVLDVPPYPSLPKVYNDQTIEFANRSIGSPDGVTNVRLARDEITANSVLNATNSQPKRYTMADIGRIERRLNAVEYAVKLSLLESSVKDLAIPSSVTPSVNRFKNGFFIDQFSSSDYADTEHREYRAHIDARASLLRPPYTQLNVENYFNTADATTAAGVVNGTTLMLPFTEEVLINQNLKNVRMSGDGQDVRYLASGRITPPSFSVQSRGEKIITNAAVTYPYTYQFDYWSNAG